MKHSFVSWLAVCCFFIATLLLISPRIAAEAVTPWVLMLIGNAFYSYDMWKLKQSAWLVLGVVYGAFDVLLIVSRVYNVEILEYIKPIAEIII